MEMEVPAAVEAHLPPAAGWSCTMCDIQVVHKLAQLLLPGLAAACVDSSSSSSSSVVELRKEMVDYITHRSIGQTEAQDLAMDPAEIVAIFLDDFASSKSGWGWGLGLGLGWLISSSSSVDSREDRIDDLVQEMETTLFWPLDRREAVAATLLRNLGKARCGEKLETRERLREHESGLCGFRPVRCRNQGCRAQVSARRAEEHDEVCLFKVLPCEQHCDLTITRHEMDRHCITTCPMKLTNCPFYQAGCESAFPSCDLESHCTQFLRTHLLLLLNHDHERLLRLEKCHAYGTLVKALDVRSLTNALVELDEKISTDNNDASSYTRDKNDAHQHI